MIARVLGAENMGILAVLALIPTYAELFGRIKFDQSAILILSQKKYPLEKVVFALLTLTLLMAFFLVGIFVLNMDWLFDMFFKGRDDIKPIVYIILISVPLRFINLSYSGLQLHFDNIKQFNRISIINSVSNTLLYSVILLALAKGVREVSIAYVFSISLGTIYAAFCVHRRVRVKPNLSLSIYRDLVTKGSALYLSNLMGNINLQVTNVLVARILPAAQVAYFTMVRARAELLNRIPDAMGTVLFPFFSKMGKQAESATFAAQAFRVILVSLCIASTLAAALIWPAVYILYGKEFLPMVQPFLIILPGVTLAGSVSVFTNYFAGIGKPRITSVTLILPITIQLAASVFLIPRYQIVGAALGFSIALSCYAIMQARNFLVISSLQSLRIITPKAEDIALIKSILRRIWTRKPEGLHAT